MIMMAALAIFFDLCAGNSIDQEYFWAARCSGLTINCPDYAAKASRVCFPRRWMTAQPRQCVENACKYCEDRVRRTTPVCRTYPMVNNCVKAKGGVSSRGEGMNTQSEPKKQPGGPSSNEKKPEHNPNKHKGGTNCWGYTGINGAINLPVRAFKGPTSRWTRKQDSITWEKYGSNTRGVDSPGTGTLCTKVKIPDTGRYYVTMFTSAPHPTEHNDCWLRFSGGFDLYRLAQNSFRHGHRGWYKAYQNKGRNLRSDYVLTIDFNGHSFMTKQVYRGAVYSLCISGRSDKFTIYGLAMVKCDFKRGCTRYSYKVQSAIRKLPKPICA